ncbi:RHS repeat-associated core domain-containing protein [Frankia sp. CiP3]|uniref:RHS repeat-associated core domain-containing protein n=1 Tax=Frankia sp. CiP3 TaxID=2880971 RepID=UPI001EF71E64|nr:RHS repeat-associated core domain-containing protein [Frankia sp. CiP3]
MSQFGYARVGGSTPRAFGIAALAVVVLASPMVPASGGHRARVLSSAGVIGTAATSMPQPVSDPSGDVAVNGWGDGAGYHLEVANESGGWSWRELAVLRPGGRDDSSWLGYQCVSGDGRYAGVAVLSASAANNAQARDRGAVGYAVDLLSGVVRPVATGIGLKYHSPGCGTGDEAAFTFNGDVDQRTTTILTVDLATGSVARRTTVAGQVTSVVPTSQEPVGVLGGNLVRLPVDGKPVLLAAVDGAAYDLRPTADGGVAFLSLRDRAPTATVAVERAGQVTTLGSGPGTSVQLFQGRAGHPVLVGAALPQGGGAGVVGVSAGGLPHGATTASLDGHALLGAGTTSDQSAPLILDTRTRSVLTRPAAPSRARTWTAVPPPATAAPSGYATRGGPSIQPIVSVTPIAAGAPTCAVPRLAENRQVLQPFANQIDWATQLAEQGLLTGSSAQRPAGYANLGLAAYAANSDFPKIALHHPTGDTWDSVPRSVYEAILAQESNWSQASWHALPGIAGNPLIADYYGAGGGINTINYAAADCGYGVGQVTTGMTAADTTYSANGKTKIAIDYEENIAAGLQVLEKAWNQLYDAGITANGGNPRYLENWYFAAWAYNTGIQPTAQFGNTTGCTPSPTCVGPDGTWGLGWTNNPKNPDYPPNRVPFLRDTYADAAHPSQWPYQERVMGWMGSPIIRFGHAAYATPTYHGGSTWLQIPGVDTFCTTDNKCDPNYTNATDPTASFCTLTDRECWWHLPATWVSTCATTCATSDYSVAAGSTEPAAGADPHPPTCSLDTSKVPTTSSGAPIIVDESQSQPPLNLVGCGSSNWSQGGTFSYTYGANAAGDPIGAIDTHQAGAGFGGHILFTHTENGSDPSLVNTGTWTPVLPRLQYYKIKIHLPATGASATDVVYKIYPGGGVNPWKIRVNQHWGSEQWVTIGTFAMQNGGYVQLSNTSSDTAYGDTDYSNFDVAYDAVAFVQMGGTPGTPIGGPPQVIDAPKGSNPAWVQCGCARRTAGDPVDTSTGYFGQTFTDLATPGRGMPLDFTRTYVSALADPAGPNGSAALNGPFGYGWTFSYNLSTVTDSATGNVTVKQEDGSQVTFVNSSGTYTPSAPRYDATLVKNGSSYVFTRRGSQILSFDVATGRLVSETDLAGSKASPAYVTALAYDSSGHLSTITDPAARSYTLIWTGSHITGLSDTAGRQVTYGYDAAGNLTDVFGVGTTRSPSVENNDRSQYTYTAAHLLNSMREPVAYGSAATPAPVVGMTYDTAERVTAQTDQLGHTTTFTYGPNTAANLVAGQTQVTDPAGHKTVYTYTGGLLISETRGAGTADAGTWSYTYDPVSLGVTSITDPNGNFQTFSYDDHGNQISASDPRGFTTSRTYDDRDNLVATIDPTGTQTSYGYDEAGHIATSTGTNDGTSAYKLPTSITLQQVDQAAEVSNGNPPSTVVRSASFYYDDAAHPDDVSRTVNARGNTTTNTYDTFGDLASTKDPEGNTTKYGYDTARGLRTSVVSPIGVSAGVVPGCTPPAKGCTTYSYDAWNNPIKTTDPLGDVSSATYDADGNRTSATDANNRTTTYTYDLADRQTVTNRPDATTLKTDYNADNTVADIVDGAAHKTTYGYDNQGRRTTRTDPGSHPVTWKYDTAGRLLTLTDAAGRVTTYGYDAAGHQTTVGYSDGATPNVTATTYDGLGRRTSTTDGTGTSHWSYDSFGEITSYTNGAGATVGYSYDAVGNVTSIAYPGGSGRTVTRTFDKDDRLVTVQDWNAKTTSFGYDRDSDLLTTTYPNNTSVSRSFDKADQLTGSTLKAGSTTLASLTSPRDAAGQVSGETPTGVPGSAQTFAYTALEQLKSTTVGGTVTSYAYDTADNPITLGAATQTFDVTSRLCWSTTAAPPANPACASPPSGATTYTYDIEGDRTKSTAGSAVTTYAYDQASRLTGFTKSGTTASYTYDGSGLRASKTVNGATTPFTWGVGGELLYDGASAYVYGPGGAPIEQVGGSATQWFFCDQLGSVRALTDSTGAVVGGYGYTPWGAVSAHTGAVGSVLGFTGQYTDAESGLLYLRARFYDPVTAQFLTVDPALDLTRSPYGYVGGNPLNDADPSGLCGFWCKVGTGLGIGAAVVGTAACIVLEPCGLVEAGGVALASGALVLGGGVTIAAETGGVVAGGAVVGGLIGGVSAAVSSANGGSSGHSSGGSSGRSSSSSNHSNPASTECIDDVLSKLRTGRTPPNLEVDTPEEMRQVFADISRDGIPVQSGYPGKFVELQDGTKVGFRESSRSGGETIDIFKADGTHVKVHLP